MEPPEPHRSAGARKAADGLPTLTEVLDWRSTGTAQAAALPVLHTEATPPVQAPAADAPDAAVAVDAPALEAAIHHAVDAALVRLLHELKPQLAAALRADVVEALVKALEQAGAPQPLPPKPPDPAAPPGAAEAD